MFNTMGSFELNRSWRWLMADLTAGELPDGGCHWLLFFSVLILLLLLLLGATLLYSIQRRRSERENLAAIEREIAIFDLLPLRVGVLSLDGRYLLLQTGAEDETRKLKRENLTLFDIYDPDFANYLVSINRIVYESGIKIELVYPFDGRIRRALHRPLKNKVFGEPATMFVSVDITEQQSLKIQSDTLAERLKITLDSIGEAVIAVDEQEKITLFNREAAALLNCTREQVIGKPLEKVFRPLDPVTGEPLELQTREILRQDREASEFRKVELRGRGGEIHRLSERSLAVRRRNGTLRGAVVILRDVTVETELHEQLAQLNGLLQSVVKSADVAYFFCDENQRPFSSFQNSDFWRFDENGEPLLYQDVIHPEDISTFERGRDLFWKNGVSEVETCFRVILPDRVRRLKLRMMRTNFRNGKRLYQFGILQDITSDSEKQPPAYFPVQ